jgi:hypothetical protein
MDLLIFRGGLLGHLLPQCTCTGTCFLDFSLYTTSTEGMSCRSSTPFIIVGHIGTAVPHYPRMPQCHLGSHTFPGIHLQKAVNEVHGILANILPVFRKKGVPIRENTSGCLVVVLAVEQRVATEQYARNDARGPQVTRPVVPLSQHLRRDVARCARQSARGRLEAYVVLVGQTEVDNLDGLTLAFTFIHLEQNVLRLDVPVGDAAFVRYHTLNGELLVEW